MRANGQGQCEYIVCTFNNFPKISQFQWITLFDDSARKIINKSAQEMATIKERDEIEFRRILHQARYRQFNFSVKTSKEMWNDENRLKMTVTNVETIDNQTRKKHIERLKAEIEALKI